MMSGRRLGGGSGGRVVVPVPGQVGSRSRQSVERVGSSSSSPTGLDRTSHSDLNTGKRLEKMATNRSWLVFGENKYGNPQLFIRQSCFFHEKKLAPSVAERCPVECGCLKKDRVLCRYQTIKILQVAGTYVLVRYVTGRAGKTIGTMHCIKYQ